MFFAGELGRACLTGKSEFLKRLRQFPPRPLCWWFRFEHANPYLSIVGITVHCLRQDKEQNIDAFVYSWKKFWVGEPTFKRMSPQNRAFDTCGTERRLNCNTLGSVDT